MNWYSSSLSDAMGPTAPMMPALLKMTSRRPNSDTAMSTAAATAASSVTSVKANRVLSPSSVASCRPRSSCTSAMTTLAPSATNRRTVASPSPLPAPVITATLSDKRSVIGPPRLDAREAQVLPAEARRLSSSAHPRSRSTSRSMSMCLVRNTSRPPTRAKVSWYVPQPTRDWPPLAER